MKALYAIAAAASFALVATFGFSFLRHKGAEPPSAATAAAAVPTLDLSQLLDPGVELRPSKQALALSGKRVRLQGFMVQMELPSTGSFFVASHPVTCDEAGAGIGDLPLDAVRVIAPSSKGKVIPWMRGPLEMSGVFEVGNREEEDGRVSAFRLTLDGPSETKVSVNRAGAGDAPPETKRKESP